MGIETMHRYGWGMKNRAPGHPFDMKGIPNEAQQAELEKQATEALGPYVAKLDQGIRYLDALDNKLQKDPTLDLEGEFDPYRMMEMMQKALASLDTQNPDTEQEVPGTLTDKSRLLFTQAYDDMIRKRKLQVFKLVSLINDALVLRNSPAGSRKFAITDANTYLNTVDGKQPGEYDDLIIIRRDLAKREPKPPLGYPTLKEALAGTTDKAEKERIMQLFAIAEMEIQREQALAQRKGQPRLSPEAFALEVQKRAFKNIERYHTETQKEAVTDARAREEALQKAQKELARSQEAHLQAQIQREEDEKRSSGRLEADTARLRLKSEMKAAAQKERERPRPSVPTQEPPTEDLTEFAEYIDEQPPMPPAYPTLEVLHQTGESREREDAINSAYYRALDKVDRIKQQHPSYSAEYFFRLTNKFMNEDLRKINIARHGRILPSFDNRLPTELLAPHELPKYSPAEEAREMTKIDQTRQYLESISQGPGQEQEVRRAFMDAQYAVDNGVKNELLPSQYGDTVILYALDRLGESINPNILSAVVRAREQLLARRNRAWNRTQAQTAEELPNTYLTPPLPPEARRPRSSPPPAPPQAFKPRKP